MLADFNKALKVLGFCGLFSALLSVPAAAVNLTPDMLAKFEKLPKAQQQQLMKQYNISPDMLRGAQPTGESLDMPELVTTRDELSPRRPEKEQEKEEDSEKDPKEQELKPFGYDLFAGEPTTFAPVSDIPIPSEYKVGPGDIIQIQLYGKQSEEYNLTINRNGNLPLPDMGPMTVTGLTFQQLEARVVERFKQRNMGVDVSVSLGELRSIRILIAGEAYKPGSYTVSSLSTITQALFVSGGVSDIGSLRNIQLKRQGRLVGSFDVYDLLLNGDASNDLRLQSGDVVFIPAVGMTVGVKGQVRRPAIYELKGGETMDELVRLAAGFEANAYPQKALLQRFDDNNLPSLINVDLSNPKFSKLSAKDGDLLEIKTTSDSVRQQVTLVGAVARPGQYQWHEGMKLSDLINSLWSDIKGQADLKYSLIAREINIQGDIEVINFSLADLLDPAQSDNDLTLSPRDKVIVFNHRDNQGTRKELDTLIDELFVVDELELMLQLEQEKKLTRRQAKDKELEKEERIEQFLSGLFENDELIDLSSQFTREELLLAVNKQLKLQSSHTGAAQMVTVTGEVRFPGEYPLAKSNRVSDLINAAGGLQESAYIQHAELTRIVVNTEDGATVDHHAIALAKMQNGDTAEDMFLQSKDHLTILQVPEWQEKETVEIQGEVRFPGTYTIRSGETITNVIKRAGGFTNEASIHGAVFTRESVKEQEVQQTRELTQQLRREIATRGLSDVESTTNFSDSSQMLAQLERIEPVGRMVVDLHELTSNPEAKDVRLEDGDNLFIPSERQVVTVVGEVNHSSTHFYKDGLSFDDYIKLAGGLKQRADDDRVYIVHADGSVTIPERSFWFGETGNVKTGDTIVVPLDVDYKNNLTLWSQVTTIFYNSAIAIAAINNI